MVRVRVRRRGRGRGRGMVRSEAREVALDELGEW